jgi:predicted RNA-binding Zn ribbon-like protein
MMQSGLDFLQKMLGAPQQRQDYQDFVKRYDQGHPSDGYSDQEAVNRYQQVTNQLPADAYQQSAQEAFAKLSPEERVEFARWLQTRAQQQNVTVPSLGSGTDYSRFQDPGALAQVTTQMHEQEPDMLTKVLTGKTGTALDNPLARAALAGVAAMAARRVPTGQ